MFLSSISRLLAQEIAVLRQLSQLLQSDAIRKTSWVELADACQHMSKANLYHRHAAG